MSLNDTPSANRLHIGFFGLRNAGKSSVVNAVTGQDLRSYPDGPERPPTPCRRPWSFCRSAPS